MQSTFKFSLLNIERCEAAFKREHDMTMGYISRPVIHNVCAKTAWEMLVAEFHLCTPHAARLADAIKPSFDCVNSRTPDIRRRH